MASDFVATMAQAPWLGMAPGGIAHALAERCPTAGCAALVQAAAAGSALLPGAVASHLVVALGWLAPVVGWLGMMSLGLLLGRR